ncbi:MAG: Ig-like domain-containing protein [Archangiaceae bacterium]|nr:Ig-like domain-containing protein [Archangiaceae bacterium]
MRTSLAQLCAAGLLFAACNRDLGVAQPPDPTRPGSIQGDIVYSQPGLATLQPAVGATVELVGSGIKATADASGHFLLKPIATVTGSMLIHFDADADGKVDHQRVFSLEEIGAGPAHDISLGQVRLGENASVRGSVLLSDLSALPAGHAGTAVFVPEGPFTVYSGDNGGFVLENLPEGTITLAFYREHYVSSVSHVELRAGEVFSLATVLLTPQPGTPAPSRVSGFGLLSGQSAHSGITVTMTGVGDTTTDAAGRYVFPQVPRGVHSLAFVHDGYLTQVLTNVLIDDDALELRAVTLTPGDSMQPDLDGGLQPFDAGTPADAGPPDAGPPDAGPLDAGTDAGSIDAGTDAGTGPVAIITAPPPFVTGGSMVMLRGDMSTGDRPLVFHWRQDAGTAVTITNNDSPLAATPTFQVPSTPQVLHFGLTVTDVAGRTSAPAEVNLPVAGSPPTATITGNPGSAEGGEIVTLTGTGNDPSGSGIASYHWVVNPSSLSFATRNGGTLLDITLPATVVTPIVVSVQLTVTNGLGITSAVATANFNLTTLTPQPWYVDAGIPQVVNGGATVTLSGGAVTPGFSGATFSYAWSPGASLPDWMLTNPSAPSTKFVAPIVVGPNKLLPFTLTATVTGSGLTPTQNVGATTVLVQDRTPPTVIATSIDGSGTASAYALWVDFSEPIDPASVTSISIAVPTGAAYPSPQIFARYVDRNRVTLAIRANNTSYANLYELRVQSVRDLAPVPNTFAGSQVFPFTSRNPWGQSPAAVSSGSSTSEPRPALVLRPTPGGSPGEIQALIGARRDDAPWLFAPFEPVACSTSPCMLSDDPSMPAATLATQNVRGHRGLPWATQAVVTTQLRDYAGLPGVAMWRTDAGTWSPLPAPPGPMFLQHGTALRAGFANNGLYVAGFDGTAWNLADAGLVSSSAADFPSDATSDPLVQAAANPGSDTMMVARTSKTGQLRLFRQPAAGGAWAANGSLATTGSPVVDLRLSALPYTGAALASYLRANGVIDWVVWGDVNNGGTFVSANAESFDTIYELASSTQWLAVSVNGLLQLLQSNIPGSGTTSAVPGVVRNGVTAADLNNDPTCDAQYPELATFNGRVAVTWQERCGAGPWKVYFRIMN